MSCCDYITDCFRNKRVYTPSKSNPYRSDSNVSDQLLPPLPFERDSYYFDDNIDVQYIPFDEAKPVTKHEPLYQDVSRAVPSFRKVQRPKARCAMMSEQFQCKNDVHSTGEIFCVVHTCPVASCGRSKTSNDMFCSYHTMLSGVVQGSSSSPLKFENRKIYEPNVDDQQITCKQIQKAQSETFTNTWDSSKIDMSIFDMPLPQLPKSPAEAAAAGPQQQTKTSVHRPKPPVLSCSQRNMSHKAHPDIKTLPVYVYGKLAVSRHPTSNAPYKKLSNDHIQYSQPLAATEATAAKYKHAHEGHDDDYEVPVDEFIYENDTETSSVPKVKFNQSVDALGVQYEEVHEATLSTNAFYENDSATSEAITDKETSKEPSYSLVDKSNRANGRFQVGPDKEEVVEAEYEQIEGYEDQYVKPGREYTIFNDLKQSTSSW